MNTDLPNEQAAPKPRKRTTLAIILITLIAIFAVGIGSFFWFYNYGSCGVKSVSQASDELNAKVLEFSDAFSIASATPRISLAQPITNLQAIKRETDDIEVPACMGNAKELLTNGMQNYINGLIAFMGQESDNTVRSYMLDADQQIGLASDELRRIMECAPFCTQDPNRMIP